MASATLDLEQVAPAASESDAARHYEVIDGIRKETPRLGSYETQIASDLAAFLIVHQHPHQTGKVATEMLFRLDASGDLKRRPDLAYVSYERWPKGKKPSPSDGWAVVPDLAVEVVSPANTATEIVKKIGHYFEAGVRLAWVIYPWEELIYVYESPRAIRVLGRDDVLLGGDVLPGFALPLAMLFSSEDEAPAAP
jgi:Uma2 family endonuclease